MMGVLPLAAIAVAVIAVITVGYTLFFGGGDSDSSSGPTVAAQPAVPAAPGPAPQPEPAAGAGADPAAPPAAPPAPPAAPAPAPAAGVVDRTQVLDFYNGSEPQIPGLSRKAAAKLTAKKWKIGEIETWTGQPVTGTTVFYSTDEQAATAAAVVTVLGVGAAVLDAAQANNGVSVVISNDYTP